MVQKRKRHSAEFKAKVALEALKEVKISDKGQQHYCKVPAWI